MGKRASRKRGRIVAAGLALCVASCLALAAACGGETAEEPSLALENFGPLIDYDPARASLERPCSLIAARDAQALTGRPYLDTLAMNLQEGGRIRCALAVGDGAMQGVVQLDIFSGDAFVDAEAVLHRQCQPGSVQPPTIAAPACVTQEGAYAGLIGDLVFVAAVRREPGRINQALSLRLLDLVTMRAKPLSES